ncbi:MAG TPA: class E sortase [Trebonia sp.]|nr:class E sortase [Trebonia sp.]
MTTQAVRPPGSSAVPGDQPAGKAQAVSAAKPKGRSSDNVVRAIGATLTLLALLILGFVSYLYAFSGVQEARSQTELYARLQGELGQGVAPTGPVIPGHPVTPASLAAVPGDPIALLGIPAIHLKNVVIVEGTSPETMTLGPGHLRDTPFPGQGGISVVFGRRATFGAPFADVPLLKKGDLITTVTSQGPARYEVIAVSDSSKPVPFSELPNQLLLLTADSKIAPVHYIEVEAKLLSSPQPESGYVPLVGPSEVALGRDPYALIPAMAWAIALAAAALVGSLLAARWSRWGAWIVTIPVIIAIVWNLYESLSALLPNLY